MNIINFGIPLSPNCEWENIEYIQHIRWNFFSVIHSWMNYRDANETNRKKKYYNSQFLAIIQVELH